MIEKDPDRTNRLIPSAGIVLCPNIGSAIVKIQRKNANALSREEAMSVSKLLFKEIAPHIIDEEGQSFAQRASERQKYIINASVDKYMETYFLPFPSITCERMFSKVGMTLSNRRKRLNPSNLESQIFSLQSRHVE